MATFGSTLGTVRKRIAPHHHAKVLQDLFWINFFTSDPAIENMFVRGKSLLDRQQAASNGQ